jgi:murein DD-endopeptidase MepM/ murein hydrolase activator NlpD
MALRMGRRLSLLLAGAALPLALWAALPLISSGQSPEALQRQIDRTRDRIEWRKGRERVLTTEVSAFTHRISSLQADITSLQSRQVSLQADLDAKRAELARIQQELRRERLRLARLRRRLAEARVELANRLVELYKQDAPDVVTVVLEADGFADLLERTEFMQRTSAQDARIIARVREAKAEATATAKRLDRLEQRAEEVAKAIEAEVAEVAAVKAQLVDRRDSYAVARAGKSELLANTRADRRKLQAHVVALERRQARIVAALRQATAGDGSAAAGPPAPSSGGLIWPVNAAISSGFGPRWGRLHAGLDLPTAEGTPLRAAASGRVALLQPTAASGGYGNYTCIQHAGALATCYAHQSRFATSLGATVAQGQVIGYSGNTGNSTGPHLHFETRLNGQPVDPLGYL